jgi:sugar phosphate isomerase/epimerase
MPDTMPMRSAITICLVPEARQGPFVFHEGLAAGCRAARAAGFDAVEIFPGSADDLAVATVGPLLAEHGLAVAAVGTGAGWVRQRLHFCHPDPAVRERAIAFAGEIVAAAGRLGAPAIIGSMQGQATPEMPRPAALDLLAGALCQLGSRAASHGQVLFYEPLNRYETNLFNRQAEAAAFLRDRGIGNVKLLCDLFHMAIEEADIAETLVACGALVGHVHWADSNRRAMGFGHTAPGPILAAFGQIGYEGFLSAEVFPLPTPEAAARQTITSLRPWAEARARDSA